MLAVYCEHASFDTCQFLSGSVANDLMQVLSSHELTYCAASQLLELYVHGKQSVHDSQLLVPVS